MTKSSKGIKLIARGSSADTDGTRGKHWYVFPKGFSEKEILEYLEGRGVAVDGYDTGVYPDCSGRPFGYPVEIRETKKSIVATQYWALDI